MASHHFPYPNDFNSAEYNNELVKRLKKASYLLGILYFAGFVFYSSPSVNEKYERSSKELSYLNTVISDSSIFIDFAEEIDSFVKEKTESHFEVISFIDTLYRHMGENLGVKIIKEKPVYDISGAVASPINIEKGESIISIFKEITVSNKKPTFFLPTFNAVNYQMNNKLKSQIVELEIDTIGCWTEFIYSSVQEELNQTVYCISYNETDWNGTFKFASDARLKEAWEVPATFHVFIWYKFNEYLGKEDYDIDPLSFLNGTQEILHEIGNKELELALAYTYANISNNNEVSVLGLKLRQKLGRFFLPLIIVAIQFYIIMGLIKLNSYKNVQIPWFPLYQNWLSRISGKIFFAAIPFILFVTMLIKQEEALIRLGLLFTEEELFVFYLAVLMGVIISSLLYNGVIGGFIRRIVK